jgi:hypothetical protein
MTSAAICYISTCAPADLVACVAPHARTTQVYDADAFSRELAQAPVHPARSASDKKLSAPCYASGGGPVTLSQLRESLKSSEGLPLLISKLWAATDASREVRRPRTAAVLSISC